MPHPPFLLAVGLVLVLAAPVALAGEWFQQRGEFALGSPSGFLLMDACGNPSQEGLDSNCFDLPDVLADGQYSTVILASETPYLERATCFYLEDASFSQCNTSRIPWWADKVSISTLGGTNVEWIFSAFPRN